MYGFLSPQAAGQLLSRAVFAISCWSQAGYASASRAGPLSGDISVLMLRAMRMVAPHLIAGRSSLCSPPYRVGGEGDVVRHTFDELCEAVGRGPMYVRRLQRDLGLHIPSKPARYSSPYLVFVEKIVALRTLNVPLGDIQDLFSKEKKILEMLHFDSMTESPTWYVDACISPAHSPSHLLLTGYDLGFPVTSGQIQSNLDFRERDPELFADAEMGADVRHVLGLYRELVTKVRTRVERERTILISALSWAEQAFR